MARLSRRVRTQSAISRETAEKYGLTVETVKEYAERKFLTTMAVLSRIYSRKLYGYKQSGHWFVVTQGNNEKLICLNL